MSDQPDTAPLLDPRDIAAAVGLLSRLPVKVDAPEAAKRGARAAWAYPIAGGVVALIACLLGEIALFVGLPAPLAAGLTLAALVIITGALHEDGLADSADGLWGGWDTSRRLEIMKDSHIGTYGVIALCLSLGLRWLALTALITTSLWAAVLVAALLSRAAMVATMHTLPNARASGLSQTVGRPTRATAATAALIAITASLLVWPNLWVLLTVAFTTLACTLIAKRKIGGQTGDILGATQQLSEVTALLTLSTLV